MSEFDKLQAERAEINRLIQNGLTFKVERTIRKWTLKGRKRVKETKNFKIQEPTLAVLDRLAKEQIELDVSEKALISEDGQNEARRLASKHAVRMARIVAIAVLNEELFLPVKIGGFTSYGEDKNRLKRLSNLFATSLKPSVLLNLVTMINTMSNLGDFCNSIRLMSVNRTTMPDRIEETKG